MQDLPASCLLVPVPAERRGAALTWFLSPLLAALSRAGWRSWRSRLRVPKRGCGARARAPTPSGTSSTPSRTPGTSWTPCTRSRSMVSWWPWGHRDVVVWLGLRLPACSGVLWLACKWLLGPACPQTCTHGTAAMLFLALCEHGAHSAVTRGRGEGGGQPWLCSFS